MKQSIIALLTDFGDQDHYVASMKGVIASLHPSAHIIDITHRVPSYDIDAAGFILSAVSGYFPTGSIFLVVIDPGVGTKRRILLAEAAERWFIAPDNGVLSRVLETGSPRIRAIENDSLCQPRVGRTFDGRDRMAPAAARLAAGAGCEEFGPLIVDSVRRPIPSAVELDGSVRGHVVYQDKFGNLITDIRMEAAERLRERAGRETIFRAAGRDIHGGDGYAAAPRGHALYVAGSLGFLEIAVREGSAAKALGIGPGDSVELIPIPGGGGGS